MNDLRPEGVRSRKRLWARVSGELATGITSALAATAIVALLGVLFTIFSRITPKDAAAFRYLIVVATLAALAAAASSIGNVFGSRRSAITRRHAAEQLTSLKQDMSEQLESLKNNLLARLDSVESHIPSVDWSYDSAEHDRGVYERLRKMVDNPDILEFKVVTIFRDPKFQEVGPDQRSATRDYYGAIENALKTRRGFDYDRVVVIRDALRRKHSAEDLLTRLIAARPDFTEHYRRIMTMKALPPGSRSEIRLYGDTGRLVDVAFAIALDKQRIPRTLVLEIGTTRPTDDLSVSKHPALGLLAFENPSPQLADAFLLAHQALRSGTTTLEHVSAEEARSLLDIN